ncbi:hypothetical protein MKX08_003178 [Trichoderma sp. CBMAI-0020]|nr:hypothetical protein MKX08_003178 [Trichoderma sp. CBMAI-0020]
MRLDFRRLIALWAVAIPYIANQRLSINLPAMGPPKPPVPHVAPIYRVTATALGAGMWFWRLDMEGEIASEDLIC